MPQPGGLPISAPYVSLRRTSSRPNWIPYRVASTPIENPKSKFENHPGAQGGIGGPAAQSVGLDPPDRPISAAHFVLRSVEPTGGFSSHYRRSALFSPLPHSSFIIRNLNGARGGTGGPAAQSIGLDPTDRPISASLRRTQGFSSHLVPGVGLEPTRL